MVGCDAEMKVTYILAPPGEPADKVVKSWQERLLYVESVSGNAAHSIECMLVAPLHAPELPLHPDIKAQVLRLLALKVPPAEILADNVNLIRESYGNRPASTTHRLLIQNQV